MLFRSGNEGPAVDRSIGPDATPKAESATHWLYQNDATIPIDGKPWKFDPEKIEGMRVVSVVRGPGAKSYTATVAFTADTGLRRADVETTIQYRKSEAYEPLLVYEEHAVKTVR